MANNTMVCHFYFNNMFTKEEKRNHNINFWGDFKKFMGKTRSQSGKKIDWLNYPTQIKYVFLRLEANDEFIAIYFDIQPKDEGVRSVMWEQMGELKAVLTNAMNGDVGVWKENEFDTTKGTFSRIEWKLPNVNYYNLEDKNKIFEFFKEKLVCFDDFYNEFNEILILLAK